MNEPRFSITERLGTQEELIRKATEQMSYRMRVAGPGIVQEFDSVKQIVKVSLAITEDLVLDGVMTRGVKIPLLVDVPIVFPRAGNFVLTMPVTVGDECFIVFADSCIDGWWQSGGIQNQIDRRRHDLSDGFAILGCWSQPNVISNYSTSSAELRNLNNDTKVSLSDSSVFISGSVSVVIEAGSTITLSNGSISVQISGSNIIIDGDNLTTIDGRVFLQHTHSGTYPGSGVTGAVV